MSQAQVSWMGLVTLVKVHWTKLVLLIELLKMNSVGYVGEAYYSLWKYFLGGQPEFDALGSPQLLRVSAKAYQARLGT